MHILLTIPEDVSDVEKVAETELEAGAAARDKKCKQTHPFGIRLHRVMYNNLSN